MIFLGTKAVTATRKGKTLPMRNRKEKKALLVANREEVLVLREVQCQKSVENQVQIIDVNQLVSVLTSETVLVQETNCPPMY